MDLTNRLGTGETNLAGCIGQILGMEKWNLLQFRAFKVAIIHIIYIFSPLFPILDLKPKKKPFKGKVINPKKHVKKKHVPFSHKSINDF